MILQRKPPVRIADIEKEIRGVKYQYGITSFEIQVMGTLKQQQSGSTKQLNILANIEKKVFGHIREKQNVDTNTGEITVIEE